MQTEIVLTKEFIEAGGTNGIGYSRKKAIAIGVPWPLKSGWKKRAIGRKIPWARALKFFDGDQRALEEALQIEPPETRSRKPKKLHRRRSNGIKKLSPPYPDLHPIPDDIVLDPNEECPFLTDEEEERVSELDREYRDIVG